MALVSHQRCVLNGTTPGAVGASGSKLTNGCTTNMMAALNGGVSTTSTTSNNSSSSCTNSNLLAAQSFFQTSMSPQQNVQPDRPIGYGAFGVVW